MNFKNIFLALLLVSFSYSSYAEPTKEQTADYILNNLDRSVETGGEYSFQNNDCLLKIEGRLITSSQNNSNDVITTYIPLEKLDPSASDIKGNNHYSLVLLRCTNQKDCIINKQRTSSGNVTTNIFGKVIQDHHSSSQGVKTIVGKNHKVNRAFKHLIKLCGGQEELF